MLLTEPRPPAPLLKHCASDWAVASKFDKYSLNTTYFHGPAVVECLQAMAPGVWDGMISAKDTDTNVIPFLFEYLSDAESDSGNTEVARSEALFVQAAVAIGAELLLGGEDVVCVAFHTTILKEFSYWLRCSLPQIMRNLGQALGLTPLAEASNVETMESSGRLSYCTTQEAGNVEKPTAVLLAIRQHVNDQCWCGTSLSDRVSRYVGLTRASTRLYIFAENLSQGIQYPHSYTDSVVAAEIMRRHKMEARPGGTKRRRANVSLAEFEGQVEWSSLFKWLNKRLTQMDVYPRHMSCNTAVTAAPPVAGVLWKVTGTEWKKAIVYAQVQYQEYRWRTPRASEGTGQNPRANRDHQTGTDDTRGSASPNCHSW